MGTYYKVTIADPLKKTSVSEIKAALEQRLRELVQALSTYSPESELVEWNEAKNAGWRNASEDLMLVLQASLEISDLSHGAFDVTVGPLVNLWGFGPVERKYQSPPAAYKINSLKSQIGYDKIEIDISGKQVRKDNPFIEVDLSAIAKGYAVDELTTLLNEMRFKNFLVDVGGELVASGKRSQNQKWRLGIEIPEPGTRGIKRVLDVENEAIATSGDYRNYFESGGKRYSHTIDPRTGWPITHKTASVSVVSSSCAMADGWATALLVLGEEEGFKLAEERGLKAYFIVRGADDTWLEKTTSAFKQQFFF